MVRHWELGKQVRGNPDLYCWVLVAVRSNTNSANYRFCGELVNVLCCLPAPPQTSQSTLTSYITSNRKKKQDICPNSRTKATQKGPQVTQSLYHLDENFQMTRVLWLSNWGKLELLLTITREIRILIIVWDQIFPDTKIRKNWSLKNKIIDQYFWWMKCKYCQ